MSTKPVNVEDYRILAQRRLPKILFDYLEGGADDEIGMKHNRDDFERYRLMPRRLVDVSKRDTGIELFGRHQAAPFIIGPTGLNGALWPKGDILLARAAERAGIPFVLATASNASIEEVAAASKGDLWFQLYIVQRELAEQMVRRAEAAGYSTLVLTTDVAVNGNRERDLRNNFGLPMRYTPRLIYDGVTHPRWLLGFMLNGMPQFGNFVTADSSDVEMQAALMHRQMDASFSWDDFNWLRKLWPRKLLVKGIIRPDDAERCVAAGADGVILSNHGGRHLPWLEASVASGFKAIKIKLGAGDVKSDVAIVADVRRTIGDGVRLMLDFNQSQSTAGAVERIRRLQDFDLTWVEEPVAAEDLAGHRAVRERVRPVPIQTGENWWFPHGMANAIAAGASDLAMVDIMKIGGVTGWMAAMAQAEAAALPLSNHAFVEPSAHVMAVAPTASWFEYLDIAGAVLTERLLPVDGMVTARGPGLGLDWDEHAVARYAFS